MLSRARYLGILSNNEANPIPNTKIMRTDCLFPCLVRLACLLKRDQKSVQGQGIERESIGKSLEGERGLEGEGTQNRVMVVAMDPRIEGEDVGQ